MTGKPIDSGLNTTKLRRIERTGSNKKLLEDLEVPTENLPQYLGSIDTITDVATLEIMVSVWKSQFHQHCRRQPLLC